VRFYWSAIFDYAGLSDGDQLAYIALLRYRNETTGLCNPSLAELAACMRCDRGTAARRLERLERAGAIERRRSRGRRRTEYVHLVWSETSVPDRSRSTSFNGRAGATVPPSNSRVSATVAPSSNSRASARSTVAPARDQQSRQRDTNTRRNTRRNTRILPADVSAHSEIPLSSHTEEEEALSAILEEVRQGRSPPLSKNQARDARTIAQDRLRAGWAVAQIVAALIETSAFTTAAVDYASSSSNRRRSSSAAQRSSQVLHESIRGER
jgi:hypothetical protein